MVKVLRIRIPPCPTTSTAKHALCQPLRQHRQIDRQRGDWMRRLSKVRWEEFHGKSGRRPIALTNLGNIPGSIRKKTRLHKEYMHRKMQQVLEGRREVGQAFRQRSQDLLVCRRNTGWATLGLKIRITGCGHLTSIHLCGRAPSEA